ncbi:LacI family DNA-binding transcriptional regulator [Peribacillus sp. SCS-26]|uniref:LacI family DNA-binding transcriptional regulator n=1 Tax=Paraperibacillus marinus TaxID=3115295 RepID=UPI003905FB52
MANIKEIAKLAGVSVTTVSRVLNHHPYVSKEKQEAVKRAMEACSYQQNINAVHLSIGQTFLIGVVIPFTNHPYFGQLVEGIAGEAVKHNYTLVLFQTAYEKDKEIQAMDMLKNKQVDALIICSRISGLEIINKYHAYGPIILCEDTRGTEISSTFIDHYKTFNHALEYLHHKGHEKIGYCIGRNSGSNSTQREKAYRDHLRKYGKPFSQSFIFHDCFNFEDGLKVVQRLSGLEDRPTALIVSSDQVAAGILTCCQDSGIPVPGDLSIIGFDNEPIAQIMKITTLEIPLSQMGRKLFLQSIDKDGITHDELTASLIERDTVAELPS